MPSADSVATDPTPAIDSTAWARQTRGICILLACLGLAMVAGRIAVVRSQTGEVPFLSANDRSRWTTISALVDDGTYAIDRQLEIRDPRTNRRTWQTIDLVRHRGEDGRQHYYSSKPPLLPTMIAGVYAAVRYATGLTLEQHPFFVGRWVLALVNLPMLAILYGCLISVILRSEVSPWAATVLTAAMVFGTLLTPFGNTLNNHLPAAMATAVALWCFDRMHRQPRNAARLPADSAGAPNRAPSPFAGLPFAGLPLFAPFSARAGWGLMFLAGLAAGFAVANELPALSMAAVWGLLAFRRDPLRALSGFVPAALLVALAFFGTNWLAHRSLRPAYAHRSVGAEVARFTASGAVPTPGDLDSAVAHLAPPATGPVTIEPSRTPGRWRAHFSGSDQLWAIERAAEAGPAEGTAGSAPENTAGSPPEIPAGNAASASGRAAEATEGADHRFVVRRWDDWYDYPGSYWTPDGRVGVDRGERSRLVYTVHMLVGHHGVFTLTPFWLLSVVGCLLWVARGGRLRPGARGSEDLGGLDGATDDPLYPRLLAAAIGTMTFVCLAFYVARPLVDRNYGGVSIAFRWLLWLVPLWIWLAIPAVALLQRRRWGAAICGGLLVASAFSVFAALENPWSHPWIYRYMDYLGWIAD